MPRKLKPDTLGVRAGGFRSDFQEHSEQLVLSTSFVYKSAAEAVNAAIAGQTHAMFDNPPTVMAQIKAGTLRALGVAAKERLSFPTFPPSTKAA